MSDSMRENENTINGIRVITTRCPTCGCQTLFVGAGGHLTCSFITCRNPSVGEAIERYKAIEQALAHFVDNANGYDKSLAHVVAEALKYPDFYALDYLGDELRRLERWGRRLLADPTYELRPAAAAAVDPHVT